MRPTQEPSGVAISGAHTPVGNLGAFTANSMISNPYVAEDTEPSPPREAPPNSPVCEASELDFDSVNRKLLEHKETSIHRNNLHKALLAEVAYPGDSTQVCRHCPWAPPASSPTGGSPSDSLGRVADGCERYGCMRNRFDQLQEMNGSCGLTGPWNFEYSAIADPNQPSLSHLHSAVDGPVRSIPDTAATNIQSHDSANMNPMAGTIDAHQTSINPSLVAATTQDPVASTLYQYQHNDAKVGSPTKERRTVSLPEDIAKQARKEREEEDLGLFREPEPTPIDPVLSSNTAGDLIPPGALTIPAPLVESSSCSSIETSSSEATVKPGSVHTQVSQDNTSDINQASQVPRRVTEDRVGSPDSLSDKLARMKASYEKTLKLLEQESEEQHEGGADCKGRHELTADLALMHEQDSEDDDFFDAQESISNTTDAVDDNQDLDAARPAFINVLVMVPVALFQGVAGLFGAVIEMLAHAILEYLTDLEL